MSSPYVPLVCFAKATACACAILAFSPSRPSFGGIIVQDENVTVHSSPSSVTTGYLDVFITLTGSTLSNPESVGAFDAGTTLDSTAAGKLSLQNAIEAGQSVHPTHTPLISASPFQISNNGQMEAFGAQVPGSNNSTPLFNFAGLATIPFTIQPGVTGVFPISIVPGDVVFSDGNGVDLTGPPYNETISFVAGSITVTPEPSGFALAGIGLVVGGWWLRRRHAASSRERQAASPAIA